VLTYGKVNVHEDEFFICVQKAVDELGYAKQLQLQQQVPCQYAQSGFCQLIPANGQAPHKDFACSSNQPSSD
jgi:hypothetical protein